MTLSQHQQQQDGEEQYQQQPSRRRRPRSKQSSTIAEKSSNSSPSCLLFCSVVILLAVGVDQAAARQFLTPVSVGLRSALASRARGTTSPWQASSGANANARTTSSSSSYDRQRSARLVSENDVYDYNDEIDDDNEFSEEQFIENSFFRASSEQDISRIRTVRYAFSPKRVSQSTSSASLSELEYLEEVAIPCAAVGTVVTAGAAPTTATSDDVADALSSSTTSTTDSRGGASDNRKLEFWESMVCGAVSRSVAQTIMHPANTMKTIMQNSRGGLTDPTYSSLLRPESFRRLSQGAGANFLLSVPHGAINFAVLEFVRHKLAQTVEATPYLKERSERFGPGLDFLSSAISTITCSVVSTPQMMITDNIMAGNYNNLPSAVSGLSSSRGVMGFYSGWWPGLVGKIPSYALTWTIFQQLKLARDKMSDRPANNVENAVMGCIASGATVCIMIPMDTIKTRLVTQASGKAMEGAYKGIIDCAVRVAREEGMGTFYRGLPPRLVSVMPMIGIQFGVYEFMKKVMLKRRELPPPPPVRRMRKQEPEEIPDSYGFVEILQEAAMEVAASPEQPFPAPQLLQRAKLVLEKGKKEIKKKVGIKRPNYGT